MGRSLEGTHKGMSAAGSQVGQMTLVFHSSLKHKRLWDRRKLWGGKGRQPWRGHGQDPVEVGCCSRRGHLTSSDPGWHILLSSDWPAALGQVWP